VLDAAPSTTTDEDWERITLLTELRPETDQLPLVQALLARDAGHVPARFRRGVLLLAKGDGTGIADIEAAMVQDANAVPAGCEAAWHYYRSRDPAKAELYRNRWQNHAEHLQRVEKERGTLTADATLAPAILAEEELESIRGLVRAHGQGITRVYLLQRILSADKNLSDLVLAFETSPLPFRTKPSTVLKRLAAQEFPRPLFIVHLGTKPFKRFRGTIKQLAIQPLGI